MCELPPMSGGTMALAVLDMPGWFWQPAIGCHYLNALLHIALSSYDLGSQESWGLGEAVFVVLLRFWIFRFRSVSVRFWRKNLGFGFSFPVQNDIAGKDRARCATTAVCGSRAEIAWAATDVNITEVQNDSRSCQWSWIEFNIASHQLQQRAENRIDFMDKMGTCCTDTTSTTLFEACRSNVW